MCGNGNVNANDNFCNSNGNENGIALSARPVASINCGYTIINCIRDNIETDYVL